MTVLQPFQSRVASQWESNTRTSSTGVYSKTVRPSSQSWAVRTVSSSSGRPVKDAVTGLALHPFNLHCYNYAAFNESHSVDYNESNSGACLSPVTSFHDLSLDKPSYQVLRNRALDQLNDKVRGDLDVAVDLAEIHQTKRMLKLTDQAKELSSKLINSFRYGKAKALSDLWLQYTYGMKPLVGTIFGCADQMLRTQLNRYERFSGRASEVVRNPRVILDNCWGGQSTYNTTGNFKVSCTIGVFMYQPDIDVARWATLNPINLAWELMPYSFVVDWFLDVGGYLHSLETTSLYWNRMRSGYETQLQAWNLNIDNLYKGSDGYYSKTTGYSNGRWIDRQLLTGYPSPSFPSFKANLGSSRLLSAAALLAQQLNDSPFGTKIRIRNPDRFRPNGRAWRSLVR